MSDVTPDQQPATASVKTEAPTIPELISFLKFLKSRKDFEAIRSLVRVTPKGLFVDFKAKETLAPLYQAWFAQETAGEIEKSPEKLEARLYGTKTPERLYLVEGKICLIGNLAPAQIQSPQQFGLPSFLGSLIEGNSHIHPSDPILLGTPLIEIKHGVRGASFLVKTRGGPRSVSSDQLNSFIKILERSPFLTKRFPKAQDTLAEGLKALMAVMQRARPISKNFAQLVPHRIIRDNKLTLLRWRKLMLIEGKQDLLGIEEFSGRNLQSFLHAELRNVPIDKLGSFRVAAQKDYIEIGRFSIRGKFQPVSARAFAEFTEIIQRAKDPREKLTGLYTVFDCFQRFSSFFQLAQPIDRSKFEQFLRSRSVTAHTCRAYGGWLFVFSKRGVLTRVVARHIFLPVRGRHRRDEAED